MMQDPIYKFASQIEIDKVALEIITTPEFQRMKGIKQAGITGLFTKRNYSRAEHSLGVYLLLKYLGATIEQCIGGLLHDIYHTNFSHTTDELLGDSQESFHEKNKYVFFEHCCGNIKQILKYYFPNRNADFFLDGENLMITKNKSFGADMLDYFMRDGYYEDLIQPEWIDEILTKIKIVNGKIVLCDIIMAKRFFDVTMQINELAYMSPFSRGQYKIFMNILKIALSSEIITYDEIVFGNQSDEEIFAKLEKSGCHIIIEMIEILKTTKKYSFNETCGCKWIHTKSKISRKLRYLDPACLNIGKDEVKMISEIDQEIGNYLKTKKEQYQKQEDLFIEQCSEYQQIYQTISDL